MHMHSSMTCFHGGHRFLHPLAQPPCEGPPPIYEHDWLATLSRVFKHFIIRCAPSTQHGCTKCFTHFNTLWVRAATCSMGRREQRDSNKLFATCRAARFHAGAMQASCCLVMQHLWFADVACTQTASTKALALRLKKSASMTSR